MENRLRPDNSSLFHISSFSRTSICLTILWENIRVELKKKKKIKGKWKLTRSLLLSQAAVRVAQSAECAKRVPFLFYSHSVIRDYTRTFRIAI